MSKFFHGALAFSSTTMTGTTVCTSQAIDVGMLCRWSIQLVWTGTPTGTFKVQESNDNTNWTDVNSATASAAGSAASAIINAINCQTKYIRVLYTNASSTGVIGACTVHAKEE